MLNESCVACLSMSLNFNLPTFPDLSSEMISISCSGQFIGTGPRTSMPVPPPVEFTLMPKSQTCSIGSLKVIPIGSCWVSVLDLVWAGERAQKEHDTMHAVRMIKLSDLLLGRMTISR